MSEYDEWFESVAGSRPHEWQAAVGADAVLRDRLLRIPTGFGKTAGTILPWLYNRVVRRDSRWPTRLVFCLPMRVLVEQTERVVKTWIAKLGAPPSVFVLLGGREEARWLDHLDRPAILIGTQDMLLSRALNRGYGSARGVWPMEMGLLLRDALWVVDEVQLMDVGLSTTTQLRAFLAQDTNRSRPSLRPSALWWMSATLQPSWLRSVDYGAIEASESPASVTIPRAARSGELWDVRKELRVEPSVTTPEEVAKRALAVHTVDSTTLLVLNTVERATKAFREIQKAVAKRAEPPELQLVHSRFRGAERRGWTFLRKEDRPGHAGRIVVATQVVEAGVDISAARLFTDLAPWSSLVQRFGRCARYAGERGEIWVLGAVSEGSKSAPYDPSSLEAAAEALGVIGNDVGPRALEDAEERWTATEPARLEALYPYAPLHVLRRRDFDDLFDTTPDMSGADLDVGRYIRSGEERDVTVFWRTIENDARRVLDAVAAPTRDELCPVSIGEIRKGVDGGRAAWVRDYLDGRWHRVDPRRLRPGMQLLLSAAQGGYDTKTGWDGSAKGPVPAPALPSEAAVTSDVRLFEGGESADGDAMAIAEWKTIATHAREAGQAATAIARALDLPPNVSRCLELAARWHDVGKAHPTFQAAVRDEVREAAGGLALRRDLAKAPSSAWRRPDPYPQRPGFRHELASTLALFETLRAAAPKHGALLGDCAELLDAMGLTADVLPSLSAEHPLARELVALEPSAVDLVAYLVCAHHGKVRCSWSSTPRDQEKDHGGIHGVVDDDRLPDTELATADGLVATMPAAFLSLDAAAIGVGARYGRSWTDRVQALLAAWGPASLAFLEACLRVADWRASSLGPEER